MLPYCTAFDQVEFSGGLYMLIFGMMACGDGVGWIYGTYMVLQFEWDLSE